MLLLQGNSAAKTTANFGPVTTALIKDIQLQRMTVPEITTATATTGKSFPACDLWKDQPAVIFVVRRPGCMLCREHGKLACVCPWRPKFASLVVDSFASHQGTVDSLLCVVCTRRRCNRAGPTMGAVSPLEQMDAHVDSARYRLPGSVLIHYSTRPTAGGALRCALCLRFWLLSHPPQLWI